MKFSSDLKALGRGLRLAARIARSELRLASPNRQAERARRAAAETAEARPTDRNPGGLKMLSHIPASSIRPGAPLVVVLHGCGQQAVSFAEDSGWVGLADQLGFPLLLPEQADDNNQGRCFRWFLPAQTGRDMGEAASIANMVRSTITTCGTDPSRVYVVGLSAGGAMAAALLAAYPDLFAGGAVIDGLAVGTATSSMQALMRMAQAGPARTPEAWAELVRQAGPAGYGGPWPRLSIWIGEGDTIVAPGNGLLLAEQWRALHACPPDPDSDTVEAGVRRRQWGSPASPAVELWTMPGAGHGYPISEGIGHEAAYVHRSPIAATPRIASFWGLAGA